MMNKNVLPEYENQTPNFGNSMMVALVTIHKETYKQSIVSWNFEYIIYSKMKIHYYFSVSEKKLADIKN